MEIEYERKIKYNSNSGAIIFGDEFCFTKKLPDNLCVINNTTFVKVTKMINNDTFTGKPFLNPKQFLFSNKFFRNRNFHCKLK